MSAFGAEPVWGWPPVEHLPPRAPGGRSVPSVAGREFLDLLSTTVVLDAYRWVLADVLALAQRSPGLSDGQLRVRLVGLAHGLGGDPR